MVSVAFLFAVRAVVAPIDGVADPARAAVVVRQFEGVPDLRLRHRGLSRSMPRGQWARPVYVFESLDPRRDAASWCVDPVAARLVGFWNSVALQAIPRPHGDQPVDRRTLHDLAVRAVEFLTERVPGFALADHVFSIKREWQATRAPSLLQTFTLRRNVLSGGEVLTAPGPSDSVNISLESDTGRVIGLWLTEQTDWVLPPAAVDAEAAAARALRLHRTKGIGYATLEKAPNLCAAYVHGPRSGRRLCWTVGVLYIPREWFGAPDTEFRPVPQYLVLVDALTGEPLSTDRLLGYVETVVAPTTADIARFEALVPSPAPWSLTVAGRPITPFPPIQERDGGLWLPMTLAWQFAVRLYREGETIRAVGRQEATIQADRLFQHDGIDYLPIELLAKAAEARMRVNEETRRVEVMLNYRRPGLDGTEIPLPPDQRPGGAAAKPEP